MTQSLKSLSIAALFVLAACTQPSLRLAPVSEIEGDENAVIDRRELVVLVGTTDAAVWLDTQTYTRGYRLKTQEPLGGLGTIMMVFELPEGLEGGLAINEVEALEPGATAGVNHRYTYQTEPLTAQEINNEAVFRRTYASRLIGWPAAGCPAQLPLGIIDASVDLDALVLQQAHITQKQFSSRPSQETDWHGTAVAELLVGGGRLNNAKLFSAAVVSHDVNGQASAGVSDILRALDWLVSEGVMVVNISLAGPYNKILDQGIQYASDQGVIMVAAAGNGGPESSQKFPAAFPEVIAVTAVDARGAIYRKAVQGDHIDISAPGVDVFVAGTGTGRYITGTSFAAPFVTAQLAATVNPNDIPSINNAKAMLSASSRDLGPQGHDETFGAGLFKHSACKIS